MIKKVPKRKNLYEWIYNNAATIISPLFINSTLSPNTITIISGVFGILGAILLISDNIFLLFFAGVCINIFAILDLVDGDVARAKKMQSVFGQWLDIFFDKLNEFLIIFCLILGVYFRTMDIHVVISGIVLMGIFFLIQIIMLHNNTSFTKIDCLDNSIVINKNLDNKGGKVSILRIISKNFIRPLLLNHSGFLFLTSIFAMINLLRIGLYILSLYSILTFIYIVLYNFYVIKTNK